jgi:hypothetical protein
MKYCHYEPRFGFRTLGFRREALDEFIETVAIWTQCWQP